MGSQSNIQTQNNLAYIAGFLDGDGSLMFQIKKRKDGRIGWRFMFTICFYQDTRHEKPLFWIRKKLKIGYISRRNDHITELRINGYEQIERILALLIPFLRFKRKQAIAIQKAVTLLINKEMKILTRRELMVIANSMWTVQQENYVTKRKKSKADIMSILDLTP